MQDRNDIITRVQKLLRMAADKSSPQEAAIAAGRARHLIDEYQLDDDELTTADVSKVEFGEDFRATGRQCDTWIGQTAVAVGKLNDCRSLWLRDRNTFQRGIQFSGLKVDAVCATLQLHYLIDVCARQIKSRQIKGRGPITAYRRGFAHGVVTQIDRIFAEREREITTCDGRSLVAVKGQLVNQRFGVQRIRKARRTKSERYDGWAYRKGERDGERVSLNRQVKDSEPSGYLN